MTFSDSNAWALEVATHENSQSGTLLTFLQYLIVVVFGLKNQFTYVALEKKDASVPRPSGPCLRWKRPKIPIRVWLVQVTLFFITSLLNNVALGYNVNVAIHIIFRSGGLAANVILGMWTGKRYSRAQMVSVTLVTLGVIAATLSVKIRPSKGDYKINDTTPAVGAGYWIGISLLTVALFLSAAMGLAQERAYDKYGRGHWEEGMFYLHFLGLPMFAFVGRDLATQFHAANTSPPVALSAAALLRSAEPYRQSFFVQPASPVVPYPFPLFGGWTEWALGKAVFWADAVIPSITIPRFWIPLTLNIVTQLVCVSGVHRLTSRVSSLTVTLVLVIRKAVSLCISVLLIQGKNGNSWLWGGATAVLAGTVIYSVDGARSRRWREEDKKKAE